jgi:hypothetical protein
MGVSGVLFLMLQHAAAQNSADGRLGNPAKD